MAPFAWAPCSKHTACGLKLAPRSRHLYKLIKAYRAIGVKAGQRLTDTLRAKLESNAASQTLFDDDQQQRMEGVKPLIMRLTSCMR